MRNLPSRLRQITPVHVLQVAGVAAIIGIVATLCAFKIADSDFWWHVRAGEIMVKTRSWITLEPFAHTREGLPYLATHEWLAQIILFLTWGAGGALGVIGLRTVIALAVFLLPLSLDLRRLWAYSPLVILAAAGALRGFVDRPQLFTFLLFTAELVMMLRYLDTSSARSRGRLLVGLIALQVLWVNLHGGAVLLGLFLFAAMFLQRLLDLWREGGRKAAALRQHRREILWLVAAGAGMTLALLASPSGIGNIRYLLSLFQDRTVGYIIEWAPRRLGVYLREIGIFWVAGIGSVLLVRRKLTFSLIVLVAFGVLSRQAFRHEMPFVFASLAITIWQLRHSGAWRRGVEALERRPFLAGFLWIIAVVVTGMFALQVKTAVQGPLDLSGYGTFEPARGAAQFLEREQVLGRMFNTYDLGGYLELSAPLGPDGTIPSGRKVFIDGRNVDFGFAFLQDYAHAAQNPADWKALEERYHLTVAVLSHYLVAEDGEIPFFGHLGERPDWALVYLDDWTAVYLKDTPENRPTIARTRYALVTPKNLENGAIVDAITSPQAGTLERELLRMIAESPESLEPRLVLARLYIAGALPREAKRILQEAAHQWPRRYEPLELLAAIYAVEGRWDEAGATYEAALARAGDGIAGVDYAALADIFQKAGDPAKAAHYRGMTVREGLRIKTVR